MNENGGTPAADHVICGRCSFTGDADDNFCRSCGMPLRDQRLPSVRDNRVPAVWRPSFPAAVARGAAVVAAGTVAEILLRRLARRVVRRTARAVRLPARRPTAEVVPVPADTEETVVSETVFLRRIRTRR